MSNESYYCHLNHFQVLIGNLKNAQRNNDTERIKELQKDIENFKRQCGVPISDEQLSKIIRTSDLNDANLSFLKTSPPVILRSLQDGDTEHSSLLYDAIKQIINRNEKHYTIRGYETFEILSDGSLKLVEPEPQPKIPDPISDAEIALRQIQRNTTFPEICTKECPHTQCSSWGIPEMQGKPCRNKTLTNEQIAENIPDLKAQMSIPTENTDKWVNPEMKRSLRQ